MQVNERTGNKVLNIQALLYYFYADVKAALNADLIE
jgi:hypothetical protein